MVTRPPTFPFALAHLPAAEVLDRLVARDRQLTAVLLAHLAEVDARRLYLRAACSSTFGYCVERLHLSEPSAYKRVRASRAARAFPVIFELLARGEIHLAAVTLLAPYLTEANHRELLTAAVHKSKREVEELVASRFPAADVRDLVRRLPARSAAGPGLTAPAAAPAAAAPDPPPAAVVAGPAAVAPAFVSAAGAPGDRAASTLSPPTPDRPPPAPVVVPLSADRYRVQFTATREVRDRLCEAQDLLRRDLPDGDLNTIIGRALELLVQDLRRRRFAATPRPRTTATDADGTRRSAHIPNAVKRAVVARDGAQCTYVDAEGHRCRERGRLEFHHCEPQGQGGVHRVETITLRCHLHHALDTVRAYGEVRVARAIAARRAPKPPSRLAPGPVPAGKGGPPPSGTPASEAEPRRRLAPGLVPAGSGGPGPPGTAAQLVGRDDREDPTEALASDVVTARSPPIADS
ncbi:MAG: hypothetical protein HY906_16440 [Deltaproteobacteria bacterium]|nr:hypothetical protein [Deltaproteobacteria bacterium]